MRVPSQIPPVALSVMAGERAGDRESKVTDLPRFETLVDLGLVQFNSLRISSFHSNTGSRGSGRFGNGIQYRLGLPATASHKTSNRNRAHARKTGRLGESRRAV